MSPIFDEILYISSAEPFDGALQMALDEVMLKQASGVILRDYVWASPTVSIGYFGRMAEIESRGDGTAEQPLIRRPTGGGLVEHGHGFDFTYSVVIGAAVTHERQLSPRASYRAIHGVLSQVLREFGFPATLAEPGRQGGGGAACFANPVGDDLLLDGTKVAGAGQKRSRGAILHQGSVQPLILPPEFGHAFASALAGRVDTVPLNPRLLAQAEVLANEKYRLSSWNRRR